MFETEISEERSFGSFVVQQLGVYVFGIVFAGISDFLLSWLSGKGTAGRACEALGVVVLGVGHAWFAGRAIANRFPHFAQSGQWVWCVPGAGLLSVVINSILSSEWKHDIPELFFPGPHAMVRIAMLAFTFPVLGCIGYALGVRFQSVTRRE